MGGVGLCIEARGGAISRIRCSGVTKGCLC